MSDTSLPGYQDWQRYCATIHETILSDESNLGFLNVTTPSDTVNSLSIVASAVGDNSMINSVAYGSYSNSFTYATFWDPVPEPGKISLGSSYNSAPGLVPIKPTIQSIPSVIDYDTSVIEVPTDFTIAYNDFSTELNGYIVIWRPIPPDNYTAIGYIISFVSSNNGTSKGTNIFIKPCIYSIACICNDYLYQLPEFVKADTTPFTLINDNSLQNLYLISGLNIFLFDDDFTTLNNARLLSLKNFYGSDWQVLCCNNEITNTDDNALLCSQTTNCDEIMKSYCARPNVSIDDYPTRCGCILSTLTPPICFDSRCMGAYKTANDIPSVCDDITTDMCLTIKNDASSYVISYDEYCKNGNKSIPSTLVTFPTSIIILLIFIICIIAFMINILLNHTKNNTIDIRSP